VIQSGAQALGIGLRSQLGTGSNPVTGGLSSLNPVESLGFAAIGAWVLGGAKFVLDETATVLGRTTTPQLRSTWFSATYWRMAAIAAVLTLPFLFAAAVQALLRADLTLLLRAAFGYLPLAMLATGIAAPLAMLLLAAADELARAVSAASGGADASFLVKAGGVVGGLSVAAQSPFLAFLIGVLTVAGALVLWMELLMREAAVYVIVLMLPLAFAGLVWPARRVWAMRAVEVLVALILSKFAIVAVLSLGGAAMSANLGSDDVGAWLAGLVLLVMAAFTPWALLRFVPLAELAAGAAGGLRHEILGVRSSYDRAVRAAREGHEWATAATARMRREAEGADAGVRDEPAGATPAGATPAGATPAGAAAADSGQADAELAGAAPGNGGPAEARLSGPGSEDESVAGAGGAPVPGAPPSPEPSPVSATAPPHTANTPADPAGASAAPAGALHGAGSADHDDGLLPRFRSRVQLDHPMTLGLTEDGTPRWLVDGEARPAPPGPGNARLAPSGPGNARLAPPGPGDERPAPPAPNDETPAPAPQPPPEGRL
jgi:hypothetical protein